jgi:site-specific DNA recombinase
VAKEYLDEGVSASKNLERRESFKAMIAEATAKEHPYDVVIVHKLDRFSRDSLESLTVRTLFKRHHIRLVSVLEPVVGSDSPEDALVEHILVGMNTFYSQNLSREIQKGLKERARQHHLVFGPPFGYKKEIIEQQQTHKRTRTITRAVIDEKTAPIVQCIFDLYDQGSGYKSIAMKLNEEGFRTNKGHLFRTTFIARTLRNRAYIGILDYNRSQARGPREPVAISGFYPPIVEEELFTKVQQKLKNESDNFQNAYAHRTQYLLSRLVVCDVCGHNYLGTSAKSGQYHYYCCRTYLQKGRQACNAPLINKEKLEKAVLDQIQVQILTEENVRKYIDLIVEQTRAAQAEPSAEEKAVDMSVADVASRIRRWEETLERGLLSLEDSAHRIKELRQEREALLRHKVDLQKKSRSRAKVLPIRTELMAQYVWQIQSRLREKKIGYKREFLREILKEVRIRGKAVTLTYRLPITGRTPPAGDKSPQQEEFFTLCELVGRGESHFTRNYSMKLKFDSTLKSCYPQSYPHAIAPARTFLIVIRSALPSHASQPWRFPSRPHAPIVWGWPALG